MEAMTTFSPAFLRAARSGTVSFWRSSGMEHWAVDRHRRVRAAEALHGRLELRADVVLVVAIEQRAEQPALHVARTHHPVGDREGQVHVGGHHDAVVVMRGMVPANG